MSLLRILVAEDSPVFQRAIRELLESLPLLSLVEAGDGVEAVRVAVQTHPDVAILDYSMPGMNGIAAARMIRTECPDLPIVLLTTVAEEYLIAEAFKAGIRGYVLKRDAGDDLVRAIDAVREGATYVSPRAARVLYDRYLPAAELRRQG